MQDVLRGWHHEVVGERLVKRLMHEAELDVFQGKTQTTSHASGGYEHSGFGSTRLFDSSSQRILIYELHRVSHLLRQVVALPVQGSIRWYGGGMDDWVASNRRAGHDDGGSSSLALIRSKMTCLAFGPWHTVLDHALLHCLKRHGS